MPSVRAVTAPSSVPAWPREGRAGGLLHLTRRCSAGGGGQEKVSPSPPPLPRNRRQTEGRASVRWQPEQEGALLALPREPLSIWK